MLEARTSSDCPVRGYILKDDKGMGYLMGIVGNGWMFLGNNQRLRTRGEVDCVLGEIRDEYSYFRVCYRGDLDFLRFYPK